MFKETGPVFNAAEVRKYKKEADPEKKRNILESSNVTTDANLLVYQHNFDLSLEDIEGKNILDLGSGKKETFSKEAAVYGAKVSSLNPRLNKWWVRMQAKNFGLDPYWQNKSVAGRAQELPYKTDSFDIILARWSVPALLRDDQEKLSAFVEMIRVLKDGGKIFIYPINVYLDDELKHRSFDIDMGKDDSIMMGIRKSMGEDVAQWIEKNKYKVNPVGRSGPAVSIEKIVNESKAV
jgi:ubiquinone/menaquinone biosynthesis C-methylase UbiE